MALIARRRRVLESIASELAGHGVQVLAVPCDVTQKEQVRDAVARVQKELGPIGILVNCAGYGIWRPFSEISTLDHERMMAVNYWGTFHFIQAVLTGMSDRGHGHVVNISAGSGKLSLPITSGYSASKAAVGALSESLRRELQGSGVAVSCLFPASVRTEFWDSGRVAVDRIPPVVRWSPKLSTRAVARKVLWVIRLGFAQRTFPIFLAVTVRLNALWPRLGDLILSTWGLPALLGFWLLYKLAIGWL